MKLVYMTEIEKFPHDAEWSQDWKKITAVFESIDKLEELFSEFDVSYLRETQQKILILNLKKYAWTLQGLILEKYSDIISENGI
jgi:hypothetical protein